MKQVWEVLLVATRLGLTSFGGPIAHIGYFREEYVVRRRWLSDARFAELVALCQFLPGPASSQLGIAIGYGRAGYLGALLAWLGFTLPSAAAMILFAYGVTEFGGEDAGWLRGLQIVVVAVVANALWGMANQLAPDRPRISIAVLAAIALLVLGGVAAQLSVIAAGAALGLIFLRPGTAEAAAPPVRRRGIGMAALALVLFAGLLVLLPVASRILADPVLQAFESFYRSGSLVFGGGHVVLPLLQAEVVGPGWVSADDFVAGYGAAQAIPGPLFTFSAYLGTIMGITESAWLGGLIALAAVFLPSFLLVLGLLPLWDRVRTIQSVRRALLGVNAAVVGILLAALYDPVFSGSIASATDFALAAAAFALLSFWRTPPWLVVLLAAAGGALLQVV
ncbi:MAG: chromate efflux transporter [Chloroflexi bacterium]|nr:chromate efflux transporter [Chloroflexota bacterium]